MPQINENENRTYNEIRLQADRQFFETLGGNTPFFNTSGAQIVDSLKDENAKEVERLKAFIETGEGGKHVYGIDDIIFMVGQDRKPTHILFAMDKTTIRAHKDRSKHLKPLLKTFAEREGLELLMTSSVPSIPADASRLGYIAFRNRKDIDDTELVSKAQPKSLRGAQEQFEPCEFCGHCGDPNCGAESFCEECQPESINPFFDEDDEDDEDGDHFEF